MLTSGLFPTALWAVLACMAAPVIAAAGSGGADAGTSAPAPLILVSIDGLHPDYLERDLTPTLRRLADEGTRARWMTPSFPSLTFPNHYTMVTGLDPDQHGIVHNTIRDPDSGAVFSLSDRAAVGDGRWWGGVPVWVSAGRAGLRSATLFWPGSEAQIDGRRPDDWLPYDERMPPGARVDQALAWLDRVPAQRPSFITLYFEQVDAVGHDAGPRSAAIDRAIAAVDRDLARLLAGLEARGLRDAVNLVVVSDHGMAATSPSRIIDLGRLLAPADASVRYWGTIIGVEPGAGRTAAVERALLRRHAHMECWRRNEIPARFRYGSNPRVAPIVCLAAVGWRISSHEWLQKNRRSRPGGAHGYDNQSPQMRAVFIAHGPAFRSNTVVDPIEARDVYGVLMAALGLPPEVPLAHPERSAAIRAPR